MHTLLALTLTIFLNTGKNRISAQTQCGVQAVKPSLPAQLKTADSIEKSNNNRIVGGTDAVPHSWPWQVALLENETKTTAFCGGAIIDNQWILTAAHCILEDGFNFTADEIKIRVGAHDLSSTTEPNSRVVNVSRIAVHPLFTRATIHDDFALLKLSSPLVYSSDVSPVCLADATDGPVGQTCIVTGWGSSAAENATAVPGKTAFHTGINLLNKFELETRLRQTSVTVIDHDLCSRIYGGSSVPVAVTASMLCAAAPGRDSCTGDSGGPLVCQATPGAPFKHVGVISFAYGCASPDFPGVYARTSTVLEWIAMTMKDNSY